MHSAGRSDLPNSFAFTHDDFQQIARMLHDETGIYLSEAKAPFVYSRLTKRLRSLGLTTFHDYCGVISRQSGAEERQQMIAALTTNVTKFFREPHHFEHFKTIFADKLARGLKAGNRVRLWSAACSTGQEPFSLAMTVFSVLPDADQLDIRILATDVDLHAIVAAQDGRFSTEAVIALPDELKKRWFHPIASGWKIDEKLASIVCFRELNLVKSWPMKGRFHAIFCRNVAIYFEETTQQKIWSRFVPMLEPEGVLYIGHSERITGPASKELVADGVTTYRNVKGAGR